MVGIPGSKGFKGATNELNDIFSKLSSGKRINKAKDDAAGLAIADQLAAITALTGQANRNIGDAQSVLQIQEGALGEISNISSRLSELSAQASNGTLSDSQRAALQEEYNQLSQEAQRIAETTEFNGQNVFQGSLNFQVGTDSASSAQISSPSLDVSAITSQFQSFDISTQEGAQAALEGLSSSRNQVSQLRSEIGAVSSRLETAQNNNETSALNSAEAESRIRDADVADESSKLVAAKIRQQAGVAVSAQSNLSSQTVLNLLQ